jgi:signal transduction histidine kinase/ActR/RegA family two-component response regulator
MNSPADDPPSPETRVLVSVPTRRDLEVTRRALHGNGLHSFACESASRLTAEIQVGAGAILTTEEVFEDETVTILLKALSAQEEWSDLPVVVLMRGGAHSSQAASVLQRLTNVTILEMPSPIRSVVSAVEAAIRARLRQYQIRNQIRVIRDAESKAKDAIRAKDDFLAALSHELRTPLNPVLLLASEATRNTKLSPETRADFELIAKNVSLEARLIDDLLDLTRITRGKLSLEIGPHRVDRIVEDAIANIRAEIHEKGLVVETHFEHGPALVKCDPVRLQQVIWNLLRNSAKFTDAGGKITVRTRRADGGARLVVEVADTGIGMAPDELETVFNAFAQGHHSRGNGAHRFGGLGLGLAIARSLMEMHSGTIRASSAGLGKGSTFAIELPLIPAAPQPARSGDGAPDSAVGTLKGRVSLRVLVVEDHEPTRTLLARLLVRRNHVVTTAACVEEARSLAQRASFDLLMTDLGLPDGSGYELMEELGKEPGLKGIALTGYGAENDTIRCREAGFLGHLVKPLQISTLEAALDSAVAAIEADSHRAVPT